MDYTQILDNVHNIANTETVKRILNQEEKMFITKEQFNDLVESIDPEAVTEIRHPDCDQEIYAVAKALRVHGNMVSVDDSRNVCVVESSIWPNRDDRFIWYVYRITVDVPIFSSRDPFRVIQFLKTTRELFGGSLTRGDQGVRADRAHKVIFCHDQNEYREVTLEESLGQYCDWAVFDPDLGWILWDTINPWTP
jgi:hypothetical protein